MTMQDKTALRRQLKTLCANNMPHINRHHAASIAQSVTAIIARLRRKRLVIAVYWAMPDEIASAPLIAALSPYTLALPVVAGEGMPLIFRAYQPGDTLVRDAMGMNVPLATAKTVVPDIMIMPMLGFNARCYRLGRGGGFYDRTLDNMPEALSIGVAASFQQQDFAHQPHDRALHYIVTEQGVIKAG